MIGGQCMTTGKVKNSGKKTKTASRANSLSGRISTATEICKIIKACRDSNVSSFEFEGLKLNFGKQKMEETSIQPVLVAQKEEIGDNNIDYLDEKDEAEQFAHSLEEMKIVDPLGYEKFLREEDVNHA